MSALLAACTRSGDATPAAAGDGAGASGAAPLTTGGHAIGARAGPNNWDLLGTGVGPTASLFYQRPRAPNAHVRLNLDFSSITPELAQNTEHSPDFPSWTLTLQPHAKFHNVAPLNSRAISADDVVFSLERYRDTSIWEQRLSQVDSIQAIDQRAVQFKLKAPSVLFDGVVASPNYKVLAPRHFEDQELFLSTPIGTELLLLERNVIADKLASVRNPDYLDTASRMGSSNCNTMLPFIDRSTSQVYPSYVGATAGCIASDVEL